MNEYPPTYCAWEYLLGAEGGGRVYRSGTTRQRGRTSLISFRVWVKFKLVSMETGGQLSEIYMIWASAPPNKVLNLCCGSGSALILVGWIRIRIQEGKKPTKNKKVYKNFMFLKCWILSFEG
jgi:hypothetical protein